MAYISLILIAITVAVSIYGFSNIAFFDRYKFNVGAILGRDKQWDRLITSAFLHADTIHLLFNMFTLYIFSSIVISHFSAWYYLVVYFSAVFGGGLLSLWMNRRNSYYSAIGASGGVVGILFAAIAIDPHIGIGFFLIPIFIPGWIFAIAYLLLSLYGMHSRQGNIGHEAHLGGATVGLLLPLIVDSNLFLENILYIGLVILPLIILAIYTWKQKN